MAEPSSKIRLTLSPQAEKYVRRDAAVGVRRMAARGALPLEPIELATVLFALLHDPDPEVKETAQKSFEELPEHILSVVLEGDTHPAMLSFLGQTHKDEEKYCEKLALNPHSDDALLAFLASLPHRRVVDIISNNQERMLRCEDIVEALGANPLTGRAVVERILTFLGIDDQAQDALPGGDEINAEAAEAAVLAVLGQGMEDVARHLVRDEKIDDEELAENLFAAVQKMTVLQKIKLARMGGIEARGLLIRDRNKVVATSAITSPKISDNEVVTYASARNVSDEVLRLIANKGEWTRIYQVKLNLANNPRCPLTASMKFLNYLQDKDLKKMVKSKDIPSAISRQARRILGKKGKL
ncbi:MAG: hypothetical protein O7G30_01430 [Proteobacteria bacterium]|nr:hypothetical protein [Pseudomonadota bacterium]